MKENSFSNSSSSDSKCQKKIQKEQSQKSKQKYQSPREQQKKREYQSKSDHKQENQQRYKRDFQTKSLSKQPNNKTNKKEQQNRKESLKSERETLKDFTASSSSSRNFVKNLDKTPKTLKINRERSQRFKCLTDTKESSKSGLITNTSIKSNLKSHFESIRNPYNTRKNPKKSNKALLLSLDSSTSGSPFSTTSVSIVKPLNLAPTNTLNFTQKNTNLSTETQPRSRRKLIFMEKGDECTQTFSISSTLSEGDTAQEAQSSDSGRSTPSKHHSEGTLGQASTSSSRPVAPLSLRRQIALALELSKDENKTFDSTPEVFGQETPISTIKSKQLLSQHRNNKGETELHLAAIRNDYAKIEQILKQNTNEHGDILIDVNVKDFAGWTPLHEACIKGHTQTVRILVTHGANVNVISEDGTTPLIDASTQGHLSIVKLLLKHGANPLVLNKKGQNSIDSASSPAIENLLKSYVKTDKPSEDKIPDKTYDKEEREDKKFSDKEDNDREEISKKSDKEEKFKIEKLEDRKKIKIDEKSIEGLGHRKIENKDKEEQLKVDDKDKIKEGRKDKHKKDIKSDRKIIESKEHKKIENKQDKKIESKPEIKNEDKLKEESKNNINQASSFLPSAIKLSENIESIENKSLPLLKEDSPLKFDNSLKNFNNFKSQTLSNPSSLSKSDLILLTLSNSDLSLISSSSTLDTKKPNNPIKLTAAIAPTTISEAAAFVNYSENTLNMSSNMEKTTVTTGAATNASSLTTTTCSSQSETIPTEKITPVNNNVTSSTSDVVSSTFSTVQSTSSVLSPANKNIIPTTPNVISTSVSALVHGPISIPTTTGSVSVSIHPFPNGTSSGITVTTVGSNFNPTSVLNVGTMLVSSPVSSVFSSNTSSFTSNLSLPSTTSNLHPLIGSTLNTGISIPQLPTSSVSTINVSLTPSISSSITSSLSHSSSFTSVNSLPTSSSTTSVNSANANLQFTSSFNVSSSNSISQNVSFKPSQLAVTLSSSSSSSNSQNVSQSIAISVSPQLITVTAISTSFSPICSSSLFITSSSHSQSSESTVPISSTLPILSSKVQDFSKSGDLSLQKIETIESEHKEMTQTIEKNIEVEFSKKSGATSSIENDMLTSDPLDNKQQHLSGENVSGTSVSGAPLSSVSAGQISEASSTLALTKISEANSGNAAISTTVTVTSTVGHQLRGRKRRRDDQSQAGSEKSETSKKSREPRQSNSGAVHSNDGGHTTEDEVVSDSGSGHLSEAPLKVPPLRIVINNHDQSREGSSNIAQFRQYVINQDAGSDDAQDSGSCGNAISLNSASGQGGPNSTPSTRITRSSHRVALQQQKHSDLEEHGNSHGVGTRKKNKNRALRSTLENERSTITANLSNAGNYSQSNSPLPVDKQNGNSSSVTTTAHENDENSSSSTTSTIHDLSMNPNLYNYRPENASARMFLSIRENVDKRRKAMERIAPQKYPDHFDDFLFMKRNYILQNNVEKMQCETPLHPPLTLSPTSPLYHLFQEQERERHRMRLRHQVEREKMKMSAEQEYFRVHCRAAHANAGQNIPLSVTSFLKDEELNNLLEFESDNGQDNIIVTQLRADDQNFLNHGPSGMNASARIKCNGRVLLKWKNDIEDKWNRSKVSLLNRQRMEAESLASTQRLNWQWKLNEIAEAAGTPQTSMSFSMIALSEHEEMVPMIRICEEFDLFPV